MAHPLRPLRPPCHRHRHRVRRRPRLTTLELPPTCLRKKQKPRRRLLRLEISTLRSAPRDEHPEMSTPRSAPRHSLRRRRCPHVPSRLVTDLPPTRHRLVTVSSPTRHRLVTDSPPTHSSVPKGVGIWVGINVARLYGGVTDVAWRGVRGVCCSMCHGASAPGVRTALTRGGARRPVAPQPRARRPPHGRRSRCLEPRRVESDRARFLVWGSRAGLWLHVARKRAPCGFCPSDASGSRPGPARPVSVTAPGNRARSPASGLSGQGADRRSVS